MTIQKNNPATTATPIDSHLYILSVTNVCFMFFNVVHISSLRTAFLSLFLARGGARDSLVCLNALKRQAHKKTKKIKNKGRALRLACKSNVRQYACCSCRAIAFGFWVKDRMQQRKAAALH